MISFYVLSQELKCLLSVTAKNIRPFNSREELKREHLKGISFEQGMYNIPANGTAVEGVCVTSAAIRPTVPFVGRELSR